MSKMQCLQYIQVRASEVHHALIWSTIVIFSALSSKDPQSASVKFVEERSKLVITSKLLGSGKNVTWAIPKEQREMTANENCEPLVKQVEQLTARVKQLEQNNEQS